jgi:elongation factor G
MEVPAGAADVAHIRNVGIAAHVDSGKTTTTERMLLYAGVIERAGEVHTGDTVMDFLPEERARGITIQSAAISFAWRGHHVNLIDTPGHVDFTVEVERSLRVLDGAVALFDAVHGVEAQSETVWQQADLYGVARVAFANKMDREGASLEGTAQSIRARFGAEPLALQLPLGEAGAFCGVVDLVRMEAVEWGGEEGAEVGRWRLGAAADEAALERRFGAQYGAQGGVVSAAWRARERLVESMANFDEATAESALLALSDASSADGRAYALEREGLGADEMRAALRRITLQSGRGVRYAVPLLCGSAYKHRGVHALMDAVVDYLPCPSDLPPVAAHRAAGGAAVALAREARGPTAATVFKVAEHAQRGVVVFFRVYSGVVRAGAMLWNATRGVKERPTKLLQILGGADREVDAVPAGHIGAAVGLRHAFTGDTLCLAGEPPLLLPGVRLPEPVFTASVEVGSLSQEKELEAALATLTRQDPSLHAATDPQTGQTLLRGMGELHLELALGRLQRDFRLPEARLGPVMVACQERLVGAGDAVEEFDKLLGPSRHFFRACVRVRPLPPGSGLRVTVYSDSRDAGGGDQGGGGGGGGSASGSGSGGSAHSARSRADSRDPSDAVEVRTPVQGSGAVRMLPQSVSAALVQSARAAMAKGPAGGFPVVDAEVIIVQDQCLASDDTTEVAARAAVAHAVTRALRAASSRVLEPFMTLQVSCPEANVGALLNDLSGHRRATIQDVASEPASRVPRSRITALVPVRDLVGYSTVLRSLTAGEGRMHMQFAKFVAVDADE